MPSFFSANSHHAPRWFWAGLLLLFVALGVKYSSKVSERRSAILRWRPQVLRLADGVDLSARFNYPNPPIMAVLLYPLMRLPPWWTALVWFALKVGMTLLAFRWAFRLTEDPEHPFPFWAKALAVVLTLRPVMSDLDHGNVNLFILFLVIGCLTLYCHRRDVLAGGVLALAIACKITPALLVPYFLWKRSWRALAGCAVGLALFFWPGVVPALVLGREHNEKQLASWYKVMVRPFVEGEVTSEHQNQSLPGLVARLATHSPSFGVWVNGDRDYQPTHYHNFLALGPKTAGWAVKGCMALFALLVVWTCRTPVPGIREEGGAAPVGNWRLAAEFSLILVGMLLFSERTWKHHCVTLMLPFTVICYHLAIRRELRARLAGALAVVVGLMASTSSIFGDRSEELADQFHKLTQVYGAWTLANLVLVGALATMLIRGRRGVAAQTDTEGNAREEPKEATAAEAPRWRASA
jgi:alpha-1,2-mannosyltransferase